MKNRITAFILALVMGAAQVYAYADNPPLTAKPRTMTATNPQTLQIADGEYLVRYRPDHKRDTAEAFASLLPAVSNARIIDRLSTDGQGRDTLLIFIESAEDEAAVLARLRGMEGVEYAEPNYPVVRTAQSGASGRRGHYPPSTYDINFGDAGDGTVYNAVKAIENAVGAGAEYAYCGWYLENRSEFLYNAMQKSDILFICAAGTGGYSSPEFKIYPAAFGLDNIVVDHDGNLHIGDTPPAVAALPDLPSPRYGAGYIEVNGEVYVAGGYDGQSYLNTIIKYNPERNAWQNAAYMPYGAAGMAIAAYDDEIYIFGGTNAEPLDSLLIFDTATNAVTEGAAMPAAVYAPACAAYGNRAFVFGGATAAGCSNKVYTYNFSYGAWEAKKDLPFAFAGGRAVLSNGFIYLLGGADEGGCLDKIYAYNTSNGNAYLRAQMRSPRMDFGTAVRDGRIYIFGGAVRTATQQGGGAVSPAAAQAGGPVSSAAQGGGPVAFGIDAGLNAGSVTGTVELYDTVKNTSAYVDALDSPVTGAGAVEYDENIYLMGGWYGDCRNGVSLYFGARYPDKIRLAADKTGKTVVVNWDGVRGATGYEVEINGVTYTTKLAKYAFPVNAPAGGASAPPDYAVRVRALRNGRHTLWSGISYFSLNEALLDARQLPPGFSVRDTLFQPGQTKWYCITTGGAGAVSLALSDMPANCAFLMQLRDSSGKVIAENTATISNFVATDRIYYITVTMIDGGYGARPYTISGKYGAEDDSGVPGRIRAMFHEYGMGDVTNITSSRSENFNSEFDAHWYKYRTGSLPKNALVSLTGGAAAGCGLVLLDGGFRLLSEGAMGLVYDFAPGGLYYIGVYVKDGRHFAEKNSRDYTLAISETTYKTLKLDADYCGSVRAGTADGNARYNLDMIPKDKIVTVSVIPDDGDADGNAYLSSGIAMRDHDINYLFNSGNTSAKTNMTYFKTDKSDLYTLCVNNNPDISPPRPYTIHVYTTDYITRPLAFHKYDALEQQPGSANNFLIFNAPEHLAPRNQQTQLGDYYRYISKMPVNGNANIYWEHLNEFNKTMTYGILLYNPSRTGVSLTINKKSAHTPVSSQKYGAPLQIWDDFYNANGAFTSDLTAISAASRTLTIGPDSSEWIYLDNIPSFIDGFSDGLFNGVINLSVHSGRQLECYAFFMDRNGGRAVVEEDFNVYGLYEAGNIGGYERAYGGEGHLSGSTDGPVLASGTIDLSDSKKYKLQLTGYDVPLINAGEATPLYYDGEAVPIYSASSANYAVIYRLNFTGVSGDKRAYFQFNPHTNPNYHADDYTGVYVSYVVWKDGRKHDKGMQALLQPVFTGYSTEFITKRPLPSGPFTIDVVVGGLSSMPLLVIIE